MGRYKQMTVKEAEEKFGISEKEIRKRKTDGMIHGAKNVNGRIVIPDDTVIIPSKKDIQTFLLQILKYKNNNGFTISRSLCPDAKSLKAVMEYLYNMGFIGEYIFNKDIRSVFNNVSLTDDGIEFVFGKKKVLSIENNISFALTINPTVKFALI
jgi:hypothetical protein